MLSNRSVLGAICLIVGSAVPASAALITFSGEDIMPTTSSPHPVSAAAAASFDAAVAGLGGGSLITFESAPLGSFSNLTIAPGVTMNGTDISGVNPQTIRNTTNFPPAPQLDGFNTTAGGANFVEMMGGTLTFSFATPIQAFGAYFSGVQNFTTDTITFSDGTSQTILIPETGTSSSVGALDFVGFTDVGKSISSVTVNAGTNGFDDIGVDDVRFQAAAVPEPTSLAIFGTALAGLGLIRRRRRSV